METRGRRVHSIEKSIRLLDCFWEARRPLSLSELERMTGWAKSTIHGLLASMLDSAVVEQNASDGKYRLGYHLFELGSAVNQGWDVPELCRPHLQALVDRLGESAYLARLSGNDLILTVCEEPHSGFRITSEVGTRLPLYCSSQGKVILAHLPEYDANRLLQSCPMRAFTSNTVLDNGRLLSQLAAIREAGYAEERQEYKLGLQSVAAPIFDGSGECRYAIGVICLSTVAEDDFAAMRGEVVAAARRISEVLGQRT